MAGADATSYSLWKWNLKTNVVHLVGPWNDDMTRPARAIGPEQVQAVWKPDAQRLAFLLQKSLEAFDARLVVVDIDAGTTRESGNLLEMAEGFPSLWKYANDREVIPADSSRIWIVDTMGDLKLRELFALEPVARPGAGGHFGILKPAL